MQNLRFCEMYELIRDYSWRSERRRRLWIVEICVCEEIYAGITNRINRVNAFSTKADSTNSIEQACHPAALMFNVPSVTPDLD
jgi:hypothetical protein